jgi:hypothetical protein
LLKLSSQSNRDRQAAVQEIHDLFFRPPDAARELVNAKVAFAQNISNRLARR